ncbi:MAG: hypothetical protein MUE60_00620 [Candidatus Eisenbacteria bacterium]|nr:hypothetical protein [Candidatus Eisenbacteria bacterium]
MQRRPPLPREEPEKRPCVPVFAAPLKRSHETVVLGVILLLCLAMCGWYLADAWRLNHGLGFPLDDSWIHLTFARNLAMHGSVAYYPGYPPVAGSTSPLYTGLLAALYRIGHNEFVISYLLGVAAFVAATLLFHALLRCELPGEPWLALAGTLLLATQPRLVLIALSGMETTLFIALIVGSLLAYRTRRAVSLGVCLGLLVWCRPDGLVLWLAIGTDWVVRLLSRRHPDAHRWPIRPMLTSFAIGIMLLGCYALFNWALSGSPLPTTFGAKGAYYRATMTREHFLLTEVAETFGGRELSMLWVFAVAGFILVVWRTLEHSAPSRLVDALFVLGLIGAYYLALPFAHRFARYILPALPSFLLVAVWAVRKVSWALAKRERLCVLVRWVPAVLLCALLVQWGTSAPHFADVYAYCCAYHKTHHVAAARWIAANTPTDAKVGTHDIGAVAFYGGRRVVDMAGIVSPEVVAHIGKPDFTSYLDDLLSRLGVTHTVTMGDWFVPANSPVLFVPSPEPEVLFVHEFIPGVSHIELPIVASLNARAGNLLDEGRSQEALGLLAEALRLDSRSSRAFLLAGVAHAMLSDDARAQPLLDRSLELFTGSALTHFELARLHLRAGNLAEAVTRLRASLVLDPSFEPAQRLLAEISHGYAVN